LSRISFLQELLTSVFSSHESSAEREDDRSLIDLCDALLSERGEMSGNRLARIILARFDQASDDEQVAFFDLLIARFDLNAEHVVRAAQHYAENNTATNLSILMDSVEPRRRELLRRLNRVPGATGQLVDMRERLLVQRKKHPELSRIDLDFQHLFTSWFNRGFLVLREIDWRTPANVLEKIIAYEAVHAINSWTELRSRLEPPDRKCFAFFHPAMLDEPLIFVEVALIQENPTSIESILAEDRDLITAQDAETAVFYSISNCQRGLAGVSFGNFLIKQVARELSALLPNLQTFRTLSPVSGFMEWLMRSDNDSEDALFHDEHALANAVARGEVTTLDDAQRLSLSRCVAHYLVEEQREDAQPLDPVARFHLGNGASLDRVLPMADMSAKGLQQSAAVMVSYLYDLGRVEENHEIYAQRREVITSSEVAALLLPMKRGSRTANG